MAELDPRITLPRGIELGHAIIADGELLGHVDPRGSLVEMVIDDQTYRVPLLYDGPAAGKIRDMARQRPLERVNLRIGDYETVVGGRQRSGGRTWRFDLEKQTGHLKPGITLLSAEDAEVAEAFGMGDIAAQVRASGEASLIIEDEQGRQQVVASGNEEVERRLERHQMSQAYLRHPLMERYFQHMTSMKRTQGVWRNTEPWHALAEKYVMTLAASMSLGTGDPIKQGSMCFDLPIAARFENEKLVEAAGWYVTKGLHDSVPYLWMEKVDLMAGEPELPAHTVTRGLVPHPAMFWSFEAAWGTPEAKIDWLLVMETRFGYEIWCPLGDDVAMDGIIRLNAILVPYGKRWPEDFAEDTNKDLAEYLLKRLSFLNSKYVEIPHVRANRAVRRDVERSLKSHHLAMPEELGAYVVELRAVAPRPARAETDQGGRDFERKHCWWRRAHNRVINRKTPKERPVWVRAALCGPTDLPLLRKTYLVDR